MFGLLKSMGDLAKDVAELVVTPVEIAVDLSGVVVKPVADLARDLKDGIKDLKS